MIRGDYGMIVEVKEKNRNYKRNIDNSNNGYLVK